MGIIKTYKNLDFTSGGDFEPTAENFPACAHFFKCDEITGTDTVLTCAITGAQTGTLSNFTNPSTGSIKATSVAALSSGSIVSPGTKEVVALLVGEIGLLSVVIGDGTGPHLTLSGETLGSQVQGDDGSKSATALTGGGVYGLGFKYDLSTPEVTSFEMNDASGYVEKAAVTLGATSTVTAMDDKLALSHLTHDEIYGIALFYFDTLPDDVQQAVAWMTEQWRDNNNKVIYPGWKGKT